MQVKITTDDIRLKSKVTTNKTIKFGRRPFFYIILGLTQSHSGVLGDIRGFFQLIPGSYKSQTPINITGIDKIHLKCDCFQGSIVNGVHEIFLYRFTEDKPPGHIIHHTAQIKLFKKINKPVLSHIRFYNEDDDHQPVDFNGETINVTCQLNEKL